MQKCNSVYNLQVTKEEKYNGRRYQINRDSYCYHWFALKFDTLATVVVAGIVTGLVGGMSIMDILSTLGSAF